jgi:polyphosphate kinase 2
MAVRTSAKKAPRVISINEPIARTVIEKKEKPASSRPFVYLDELSNLKSKRDLETLYTSKNLNPKKLLETIKYEEELEKLQAELVRLQQWVVAENKRVAILFEGRDSAGKGGTIRRFTEHLNPRNIRVVALTKPTDVEQSQWYFQRYINELPNKGEIVFFDRSWYNRAVVEPVNGFCTEDQYKVFMQQVTEYENMLIEDGLILIKFWFSISKDEQLRRFKSRMTDPLKQWKISPVDMEAQQKWDIYTKYKEQMFSRTHSTLSPWILISSNNKQKARLESIRYVLSILDYKGKEKSKIGLIPNEKIVARYHRSIVSKLE